ncbi:MAG: hypothetical protein FWG50_08885 [Kiritimatiellaeota bacterium]|nr:hypothetical protein [Kiritimatiellota bacterium]
MMTRWFCALLLAGLVAAQVCVGDDEMNHWAANAKTPVPDGARVTLHTERNEYFLGEEVLVRFVLENTGEQPFEAEFGGDYRGASRALRFNVTAVDETGQAAEDPDPSKMRMGGLTGPEKIPAGGAHTNTLALMRYCKIVKPGRYTVRAAHDFGWKEEGERKRPVGETVLTFREPTPDEAAAVVDGLLEADAADFTLLTHPVYFAPLLRHAKTGSHRALLGLGCIATREATEALTALTASDDPDLALAATRLLLMRLPPPANERPSFWNSPPFTREFRQHLAENAWDDAFAPTLRAWAAELLQRPPAAKKPGAKPSAGGSGYFRMDDLSEEAVLGAKIMQHIGTPDDAPVVLKAMDRTLGPMVSPRNDPKDNILDLPQPLRDLISAMDALHARGYDAIREGRMSGDAQILLYFHWLADEPGPRSPRWLVLLDTFGKGNCYPTTLAALASIPKPLPDACVAFVKGRLEEKDLGVCRAACEIAGESGNTAFLEPLIEIVATEQHEWLFRAASNAAKKLGGGDELLQAWADRLNDEHLYNDALGYVSGAILGDGRGFRTGRTDHSRATRLALRDAWRKFLADNADDLRQGKVFTRAELEAIPGLLDRQQ